MRAPQTIRDVWRQQDLKTIDAKERFDTEVNPHGVVLLKLYPGNPRHRIVESARGVERKI